jgi:hypothetical protein
VENDNNLNEVLIYINSEWKKKIEEVYGRTISNILYEFLEKLWRIVEKGWSRYEKKQKRREANSISISDAK